MRGRMSDAPLHFSLQRNDIANAGASFYNAGMCGRFTKNYTWQQIHAMYRLNAPAAIPNMQPSFNVCPTDPVDTVVAHEGSRELVQMRWGLVPYWWNKPLKELRLATFNARIETVTTSRSSANRSSTGGV
jgi:putative SOS response-associated peptidase YedK